MTIVEVCSFVLKFIDSLLKTAYLSQTENIQVVREALQAASQIKEGSVVQITDESHAWFLAFVLVTEVKSWGIQGCCLIPHSNTDHDVQEAYNRLTFDQIELVGQSLIIPQN